MHDNITNTRKSHGYVYLVQDADGLYKIGYSANPEARLSSMQSGNPRQLTLISKVLVANRVEAERLLHSKLHHLHVVREWYRFDDLKIWHEAILTVELVV